MQKQKILQGFAKYLAHGFAKIMNQRNLFRPAAVDLNHFDEEQDPH
jgi:hypothetical protein